MNAAKVARVTAQLNELARIRRAWGEIKARSEGLLEFLEETSAGTWQRAPHLEYLAARLEGVAAGEVRRLMVFMPPRHGKSSLVSRGFPAYYLGRHPDREIILASYGAELANDFSRKARSIVFEYGNRFDPPIALARDSKAVNRWHLSNGRGAVTAAGVGGGLTGKGASLALIDDPLKDWAAAQSKTIRDAAFDWYQSVLRTRLAPGGSIILVQTRWHEDDLAGRLLREMAAGGESWEVVNLPAIAEEHDALGRRPGEALWPAMFPLEELEATRRAIGATKWAALYQQRPQAEGGGLFRRSSFRYYEQAGDTIILHALDGDRRIDLASCWLFQTVDPAATTSAQSDYFAAGTWAVTPDSELVLLDLLREKAETVRHIEIMDSLWYRWHPKFQAVENRTFGLNIIQELKRRGRPVVPCKADQDKFSRALPISARYEAGMVYHPSLAPWIEDLEGELLSFPNGTHDDMVDVVAYAAILLAERKRKVARASEVDLSSYL